MVQLSQCREYRLRMQYVNSQYFLMQQYNYYGEDFIFKLQLKEDDCFRPHRLKCSWNDSKPFLQIGERIPNIWAKVSRNMG